MVKKATSSLESTFSVRGIHLAVGHGSGEAHFSAHPRDTNRLGHVDGARPRESRAEPRVGEFAGDPTALRSSNSASEAMENTAHAEASSMVRSSGYSDAELKETLSAEAKKGGQLISQLPWEEVHEGGKTYARIALDETSTAIV